MSACRPLLLPSFKTALVVGSLLTVANQWKALRAGALDREFLVHALINISLPFVVSMYSRWSAQGPQIPRSTTEAG